MEVHLCNTRQVHSMETTMLQTVEQAYDKTAALGKALYSQLFLWLVAKLNTTISAPQRCYSSTLGAFALRKMQGIP